MVTGVDGPHGRYVVSLVATVRSSGQEHATTRLHNTVGIHASMLRATNRFQRALQAIAQVRNKMLRRCFYRESHVDRFILQTRFSKAFSDKRQFFMINIYQYRKSILCLFWIMYVKPCMYSGKNGLPTCP